MRIQSDREYARQRAARDIATGAVWQREAEVWFDGTVESVDRRLAMCKRMLADARIAACQGLSEHRLARIADYEQQQVALDHLRRQLLTAASDREAAGGQPSNPVPSALGHKDHRWVSLEAAKFHRANTDVDLDELRIRAANHAEYHTGTRSRTAARDITEAFVDQVIRLRRNAPRPRVAAAQPGPPRGCPDEMMFM